MSFFFCSVRTIARLTSMEVVDVKGMVGMFLYILAYEVKTRVIQREFMRSGETISRHFNMVLLALIHLHDELLKKPQPMTNSCTDPKMEVVCGLCFYLQLYTSAHRTYDMVIN